MEIKHKYKLLADSELELMSLHLSLTKDLNSYEMDSWHSFESQINYVVKKSREKKKLSQARKLNFIREKQSNHNSVLKPQFNTLL